MSKKRFINAAIVSILSIGTFAGFFSFRHIANEQNIHQVEAVAPYTNGDGATYYDSISNQTGSELLKALQTLNNNRKKTSIGYGSMWNYYNKTDYDPNNPSKYLAFYRGTSADKSAMNKEHVWPKSRGGNKVEGDIHMPRPTLTSDNSDRGNSFYVEGKVSTTSGWDPGAAGMNETYRGDSARIIFYCVVADSSLSLVDKDNDSASNGTMGKLSDLLKWNLKYPVQDREKNRNEGCESVQGNRNPFIDHPEYACKIWGNYNETTKAICQGHMDDETTTETLKVSGTLAKTTYQIGEDFDPTGLVVIYNSGVEGEADVDVTSKVTWNPSKLTNPGNVAVYAKYNGISALAGTVKVLTEAHVTDPIVGKQYQLAFTNGSAQYFADGSLASSNYSLGTTTDRANAASLYLEEATGGYYVKLVNKAGSATYIESYVDGDYVDLRLSTSPITVWSFNTTHHVLTTEISGCGNSKKNGTNFLGSYNAYTDIRISSFSYVTSDGNYPAHIYEYSEESTPAVKTLTITGKLAKYSYVVGETLSTEGLTVTYFDGEQNINVTSKVTWNLNKFDTAGTFTLKATYNGLTAIYGDITVKEAEAPVPGDNEDVPPTNNDETKKNSGGCKASITSNSSIVFISSIVLIAFAIKMAIKSKKEN